MAFPFTPQQQQQPQQNLFQPQQQSPFQQNTSLFQPQQQQQQFQLQQFQQPQQHQQQQQQQLFLFTNEKTPANYSTKWADLHPDSQKFLLQIEEKVLEYRDESQRLDQCSRLYDSSVSNDGFELDASHVVQELGGISVAMERQKAVLHELMAVVKDMLRNTEVSIRSFMMLRPRFVRSSTGSAVNATTPSQALGAAVTPSATTQPTATSLVPVFDFYNGLPRKPSPFLQQTVYRFEKYIGECRQWIEEIEQLLLVNSDRNSLNSTSTLLQSLPKVMSNVHDFFVHVAAKVESIHQYMESMKTAYLADQRRRGDGNDPFLEADRRETAKQEAAARRVHPTLHLPAVSQPSTQVAGLLTSSAAPATSSAPQTSAAVSAVSSGSGLFGTPSASNLFSTPVSSSAPTSSLFGASAASPQTSLFGSSAASPQTSLFGPSAASPQTSLFGPSAASPQTSLFGPSAPSFGGGGSLFGSTPAAGASTVATPSAGASLFGSGAATGSGASFGTASKARAKSRTGRR